MSAAAEVLAADARRYEALIAADAQALGELLAEDLIHTHTNALTQNKAELIAMMTGPVRYRSAQRSEEQVRVFGDAAVHSGRAQVQIEAQGQTMEMSNAFVLVWVKRGGRWQVVHFQATKQG